MASFLKFLAAAALVDGAAATCVASRPVCCAEDQSGLTALEACKTNADVVTCGTAIVLGSGSVTVSAGCTTCLGAAVVAAGWSSTTPLTAAHIAAAESVCSSELDPPAFRTDPNYAGAKNLAVCVADALALSTTLGTDFTATCPAGAQVQIDSMYKNCDGAADWETEKAAWKSLAERKGCGGAAQAVPAIALVAAAVVNMLN